MQRRLHNTSQHSLWVLSVVLAVGIIISVPSSSQARTPLEPKSPGRIQLVRMNPAGWFTMLVPASSAALRTKADIDGGFFEGTPIRVNFSYYAYVNTPNFLIDTATGRPYPDTRRPELGARGIRIGGQQAWIKTLSEDRWRKGFRFGYRVEFFDLPVSIGGGKMLPGTIYFEISTNNSRYLRDVRKIIHSIQF